MMAVKLFQCPNFREHIFNDLFILKGVVIPELVVLVAEGGMGL